MKLLAAPFIFLWKMFVAFLLVLVFVTGITSSMLAEMFRAMELWAYSVLSGDR